MKYLLILSLLLFARITAAQNCSFLLFGTVKAVSDKAVLPGTTITLLKENKIAIADEEGHFHFNNLCPGTYHAEISYVGFGNKTLSISLSKNQEIEIYLSNSNTELSEVKIVSSVASLGSLQTSSRLDNTALELTRGESLGEAIKRLPGVNSIQTGPAISKPVIHGMHSNRVLIYNSGVRLEGQQWGSEHAPEVDPFLANEITVVKGAASVRYGSDALGGVILVDAEPLNYHTSFSGDINLVGASNNRQGAFSGRVQGASKKETFAWRLQSTLKKAGNSSTPHYFLNNTGFKEFNGSLTLGYKKKSLEAELFLSSFNTTVGIFEWAHIGSEADRYRLIENGRPFNDGNFSYDIGVPRQEVGHQLLKFKGKKYFTNNATLTFAYSFQRNNRKEFDLRRAGLSTVPGFDFRLTAQNLDVIYETFGAGNIHTSYGLNTSLIVNNHVPGTSATPLIPNYDSFNPGVFFIKKLEKEKYELEAGVRYDYKHLDAAGYDKDQVLYGGVHNFHNVSGSLGGLLRISKALDFQSNLGLAWRPPSINELYSKGLHHGSATVEQGDKGLDSEKGLKWINTLKLNSGKFNAELSAYGNYINNYIFLVFSGQFEEGWGGAFPVFSYQQTNASFYGADFSGAYAFSNNFSWSLKAAMVRAKDLKNRTFLPMIPADRIDNSLRWEKNRGSRKLSRTFFELQHLYVAKQNRFELPNEFASPPSAYHLLNLSGGINYKIGEQSLGLNASIFNLLDNSYKDYLNRFRYYAHETGRNVVIRLNYKF